MVIRYRFKVIKLGLKMKITIEALNKLVIAEAGRITYIPINQK